MAAGTLTYVIDVDDRGEAKIRRFDGAVNQSFTRAEKGSNTLLQMFKKIGGAAVVAGGLIAGAIGGIGLASATADALSFNKQFSGVVSLFGSGQKATAAFGRDLGSVQQDLKDMSGRLGTTTELTRVMYQTISSGVPAAQALDTVRASAELAAAGMADAEESAKLLTTVTNAYPNVARGAAGAADVLFNTVKLGKVEVNDLAQGFGNILPAAQLLGVQFEEVAAGVAALSLTQPAAIAMTNLQNTFTSLAKEADDFKKAGIDIVGILKEKGLAGAIDVLRERFGNDPLSLRTIIKDQQALAGIVPLITTQYQAFTEALDSNRNAQGTLAEANRVMALSYEGMVKELGGRVRVALQDLAEAGLRELTPTLLEVTARLRDLAHSNDFKQFLADASAKIRELVTAGRELGAWTLEHRQQLLTLGEVIVAVFVTEKILAYATALATVIKVGAAASATFLGISTGATTAATSVALAAGSMGTFAIATAAAMKTVAAALFDGIFLAGSTGAAFATAWAALAAVTVPVGVVVAAFAALGVALYKLSGAVVEFKNEFGDAGFWTTLRTAFFGISDGQLRVLDAQLRVNEAANQGRGALGQQKEIAERLGISLAELHSRYGETILDLKESARSHVELKAAIEGVTREHAALNAQQSASQSLASTVQGIEQDLVAVYNNSTLSIEQKRTALAQIQEQYGQLVAQGLNPCNAKTDEEREAILRVNQQLQILPGLLAETTNKTGGLGGAAEEAARKLKSFQDSVGLLGAGDLNEKIRFAEQSLKLLADRGVTTGPIVQKLFETIRESAAQAQASGVALDSKLSPAIARAAGEMRHFVDGAAAMGPPLELASDATQRHEAAMQRSIEAWKSGALAAASYSNEMGPSSELMSEANQRLADSLADLRSELGIGQPAIEKYQANAEALITVLGDISSIPDPAERLRAFEQVGSRIDDVVMSAKRLGQEVPPEIQKAFDTRHATHFGDTVLGVFDQILNGGLSFKDGLKSVLAGLFDNLLSGNTGGGAGGFLGRIAGLFHKGGTTAGQSLASGCSSVLNGSGGQSLAGQISGGGGIGGAIGKLKGLFGQGGQQAGGEMAGGIRSGLSRGVGAAAGYASAVGGVISTFKDKYASTGQKVGQAIGTGVGAYFGGPVGAMIGGKLGNAIGGLIQKPEFKRIGKEMGKTLGFHMSDEAAKAVADLKKKLKVSRKDAETLGVGIAIQDAIQQGQLGADNFDKFALSLTKNLLLIGRGGKVGEQALKTVQEGFASLIPEAEKLGITGTAGFVSMVKAARASGQDIPALFEFMQGRLEKAADGMNRVLAGVGDLGVDRFQRLGRITSTVFGAMASLPGGALAAVEKMGPGIDKLIEQQKKLGVEGDAAFQQMVKWRNVVQTHKPLFESIAGLTDVVQGLNESGSATAPVLADIGAELVSNHAELLGAGLDENEAIKSQVGLLQQVVNASQANGIALDGQTQSLVDQAAAMGLVKTSGTSLINTMQTGFNAVIAAITKVPVESVNAFGATTAVAQSAAAATQTSWTNAGISIQQTLSGAAAGGAQAFVGAGETIKGAGKGAVEALRAHLTTIKGTMQETSAETAAGVAATLASTTSSLITTTEQQAAGAIGRISGYSDFLIAKLERLRESRLGFEGGLDYGGDGGGGEEGGGTPKLFHGGGYVYGKRGETKRGEGVLTTEAMGGIGKNALDWMNIHHSLPPTETSKTSTGGFAGPASSTKSVVNHIEVNLPPGTPAEHAREIVQIMQQAAEDGEFTLPHTRMRKAS